MVRKARFEDLECICAIYDAIHAEEETGKNVTGWVRSIYPTRATAEHALEAGDLFVEEDGEEIVASARINREQVPEYADAAWRYDAPADQVMVLHTLTVSPAYKGRGYGPAFVAYYERYAREHGCSYLRIDTNARNLAARKLYRKLGYTEVSIVPCVFNGIEGVQLVCLEKKLNVQEKWEEA